MHDWCWSDILITGVEICDPWWLFLLNSLSTHQQRADCSGEYSLRYNPQSNSTHLFGWLGRAIWYLVDELTIKPASILLQSMKLLLFLLCLGLTCHCFGEGLNQPVPCNDTNCRSCYYNGSKQDYCTQCYSSYFLDDKQGKCTNCS
jgi:hypothetical protein